MKNSSLVQAIKEKNSSAADKLIKSLRPRLVGFLRIRMSATKEDAEDCAQEAVLICLKAIEKGTLRNPESVYTFLISTCRNLYISIHKRNREYASGTSFPGSFQHAEQLNHLLDEEKNRLLSWCLDQLKRGHREFIEYWFELPDSNAESAAHHFGISKSNVWTRKHRILSLLNKCYEKKSNR